jgi:hypothetical protein
MATKNLTELDFDGIRNNLKLYLQSQEEFSDYDFEASGLTVLLDLLAYNTHYNAFLAHMTANEAFLDSAIKRNSVASIAKTMGYTARSARAARATINLEIVPDVSYNSSSLTLSRNTIFSTTIQGKTYSFFPKQDYTTTLTTVSGVEKFVFTGVEIIEGLRVVNSEIVEAGGLQGPVLMANPKVDTTTVRCRVQESLTNTNLVTYTFSDNILDATASSKIFYIEEALNGFYQVTFGDGVLGSSLAVGNIVRLDYIATNASEANGATTFTYPTNFTGSNESTTLTVTSPSAGGAEQETVDSIRFNAPRFNATKNRAVTANDYKSLILSSNPNVKSVAVWGGEDNDPPMYGKVFVSLQPNAGLVITQDDKDTILRDFIEPRQPISIRTEFVDPEFTYIGMTVGVNYDSKVTLLSSGQIQTAVNDTINAYFNNTLNTLDANFYYSKLTSEIIKTSTSIVSANLELRIQKRFTPTIGREMLYPLYFNNKLQPGTITSNYFNAIINTATYNVYITDVANANVVAPLYNGSGTIVIKSVATNEILNSNAGTINYDTGVVTLNSLNVSSIAGSVTNIRVSAQPHESAKDIKTENLRRVSETSSSAVIPQASKNIILTQDLSSADIPNNILTGISVTATPKVSDY